MSEQTYYFNSYSAGETWETSPGNMADGSTATFASATTNGDTQLLNGNTCDGSNLGTITKVEYRVYGYVSDTTRVNIECTPIFSSGNGSSTIVCDWTSAAWSNYVDITSGTNAPGIWSWTDVQNLDMRVNMARILSQTRYAYVAKIELLITYTASSGSSGQSVRSMFMFGQGRR